MEQYTFPNGIAIQIKYINRYQVALLRAGLDTKYPKPAPPVNSTETLGDIANPDDPAYALALSEWETRQGQRLELMVLRACCAPVEDPETVAQRLADLDANTAAVQALMTELGVPAAPTSYEEYILAFDASDAMRYLYLVAAGGDPAEINTVLGMIGDTVDRTEDAIKAMEATF